MSPTFSFSLTPFCASPQIVRPQGVLPVSAGIIFTYTIPRNSFIDREDGDTRMLLLTLKPIMQTISTGCWYMFNSTTQLLMGLPYANLLGNRDFAIYPFELTATDSCGLQGKDNLSINVRRFDQRCFEINIVFQTLKSYDCEFVPTLGFTYLLYQYYGFQNIDNIRVVRYEKLVSSGNRFRITLTFTNSVFPCSQCTRQRLLNLTSRILNSTTFEINPNFNTFISPEFTAISITVLAFLDCGVFTLPFAQRSSDGIPIWAWLIPLIIFGSALLLILLLSLCRCCWQWWLNCLPRRSYEERIITRQEMFPKAYGVPEEVMAQGATWGYSSVAKTKSTKQMVSAETGSADSAQDALKLNDVQQSNHTSKTETKASIGDGSMSVNGSTGIGFTMVRDQSEITTPVTTLVFPQRKAIPKQFESQNVSDHSTSGVQYFPSGMQETSFFGPHPKTDVQGSKGNPGFILDDLAGAQIGDTGNRSPENERGVRSGIDKRSFSSDNYPRDPSKMTLLMGKPPPVNSFVRDIPIQMVTSTDIISEKNGIQNKTDPKLTSDPSKYISNNITVNVQAPSVIPRPFKDRRNTRLEVEANGRSSAVEIDSITSPDPKSRPLITHSLSSVGQRYRSRVYGNSNSPSQSQFSTSFEPPTNAPVSQSVRSEPIRRAHIQRDNWASTKDEPSTFVSEINGNIMSGKAETHENESDTEEGEVFGSKESLVGEDIKTAKRQTNKWDQGEMMNIGFQGDFSDDRVNKAKVGLSKWAVGEKMYFGESSDHGELDNDTQLALIKSSNWARAKRRRLSDSRVLGDLNSSKNMGYCASTESLAEQLRLPATPAQSSVLRRSSSLPDILDNVEKWPKRISGNESSDSMRRNPKYRMDSANVLEQKQTRRKRDSRTYSKSKTERNTSQGIPSFDIYSENKLDQHREDVPPFNMYVPVQTKVPVKLRAKVTKPLVISGPLDVRSLTATMVELPNTNGTMPDKLILNSTPKTKVTIGGKEVKKIKSSDKRPLVSEDPSQDTDRPNSAIFTLI